MSPRRIGKSTVESVLAKLAGESQMISQLTCVIHCLLIVYRACCMTSFLIAAEEQSLRVKEYGKAKIYFPLGGDLALDQLQSEMRQQEERAGRLKEERQKLQSERSGLDSQVGDSSESAESGGQLGRSPP